MVAILVSVACFVVACQAALPHRLANDVSLEPDAKMNVSQLVMSKGYPFEEHPVVTADGYILGLQRIPHGKTDRQKVYYRHNSRPVILLQHGLLSCSACWVENLVNESFGFLLADHGVDVWLANSRGNTYSKQHVSLRPDQDEFWKFSWDEMAKYDLPAMIDYILQTTGSSQIYYVGHSQGTEIAFSGFGMDWNKDNKVKQFFAMAPVTFLGHMKSPVRILVPFVDPIEAIFELLGVQEFLPSSDLIKKFGQDSCAIKGIDFICENVLFLLGGYDFKHTNASRIPVYVAEHPAGTSVQNMAHYAQSVKSNLFQMYDFGSPEANVLHYNQTTPPLYDVSKMTVPTVTYWATHDWLSDPADVNALLPLIPNLVDSINLPEWNHLDFLWAMNAPDVLYDDIIKRILQDTEKDVLFKIP